MLAAVDHYEDSEPSLQQAALRLATPVSSSPAGMTEPVKRRGRAPEP